MDFPGKSDTGCKFFRQIADMKNFDFSLYCFIDSPVTFKRELGTFNVFFSFAKGKNFLYAVTVGFYKAACPKQGTAKISCNCNKDVCDSTTLENIKHGSTCGSAGLTIITHATGFCLESADKAMAHMGCITVAQLLLMKFFTSFSLGSHSENFRNET